MKLDWFSALLLFVSLLVYSAGNLLGIIISADIWNTYHIPGGPLYINMLIGWASAIPMLILFYISRICMDGQMRALRR